MGQDRRRMGRHHRRGADKVFDQGIPFRIGVYDPLRMGAVARACTGFAAVGRGTGGLGSRRRITRGAEGMLSGLRRGGGVCLAGRFGVVGRSCGGPRIVVGRGVCRVVVPRLPANGRDGDPRSVEDQGHAEQHSQEHGRKRHGEYFNP